MPADFVSGDIYDIARLDEDCFGFSIADATGHGLPAALLTVFIKNLLRGKEITDTGYRIIEPDEVLMRLNSELLSTNLSQCQFVTALHAIFDRSNNTVRWARGGVPYPILLRPGQAPQLMRSHGGLTGALGDQRFEIASCRLAPEDTLLLFTDGIEALLMDDMIKSGNTASIIDTQWLQQVIHDGPAAALSALRDNALSLGPRDWAKDDITVLALRMN
jgi:sigma-B regulation protein RsbU (phosphoserine phosphatase)